MSFQLPCRHLLLAGALAFSLIACAEVGSVAPDAPAAQPVVWTNSVSLKIGDTRLYRRLFLQEGVRKATGEPDTLYAYKFVKVIGDTQINGMNFFLLESRVRDIEKDSIRINILHSAIHVDDSSVIEVKLSKNWMQAGIGSALFGRIAATPTDSTMVRIAKDSIGVFDVVSPLRFSLRVGDVYTYRCEGIAGNMALQRRYLGMETVETVDGNRNAWKFATVPLDYFPKGMSAIYWFEEQGLLKFRVDQPAGWVHNFYGDSLWLHVAEQVEYMGTKDISEDTLYPWSWHR
jgi:hypothetical protein